VRTLADKAGRIDLDLGVDYKGFNRQITGIAKNTQRRVGGAFKGVGKMFAAAFAVKKLFDFGKAGIKLASDLTEVQNVVDVTFGNMNKQVNEWSKNMLYGFGLSELSAKKYSSTMGAMLKSSGIFGQELVDMSQGITELAADFASFYNLDSEQAFQKIRSGLMGETEPLKQIGKNLSVANLEAYALSQGIRKSFNSMSQSEKTLLRYNYLLSISQDAMGDFARTSDSWANQTRLLSEQWKIFSQTMGQAFINILTPTLKIINSIIQKLQVAAEYFKAFTEMVFGASDAASDAAKSTDSMGGAVNDMSKDIKKAGKAIDGSLGSFDQLNLLSQDTAKSMAETAGMASMVGIQGAPSSTNVDVNVDESKLAPLVGILDKVKGMANGLIGFFKENFGPGLRTMFETLSLNAQGWKEAFGEVFQQIPLLAEPLKNWFNTDLRAFFSTYLEYLTTFVSGVVDSALKIFNTTKDAVMPIIMWFFTDGLPLLTQVGIEWNKIVTEIFKLTKVVFDKIYTGAVAPAMKFISHLIVSILGSLKTAWDKWGVKISTGLMTVVRNLKQIFIDLWEKYLKPVWNIFLKALTRLWDNHLKKLVDAFLDLVGELVAGGQDIYNKVIAPIIMWLIDKLAPVFVKVFGIVTKVLETALGIIIDVVTGIIKALKGIIEFLVGVFTGDWDKAWSGIKNTFIAIFDTVKGYFEGIVNAVIKGINLIIRGLNSININVPDWVPALGGKNLGFNIRPLNPIKIS
jgi:hypothetical protein